MMALSTSTLAMVALSLFAFSVVTYLLAGRMRAHIELSFIFSIGMVVSLFLGYSLDTSQALSTLLIPLITSLFFLFLFYVRFKHHVAKPYKEILVNSDRVLNQNDMRFKFEIGIGSYSDMELVKNNQVKFLEKFSSLLQELEDYKNRLISIFDNMGNQTHNMSSETSSVGTDISQMVSSSTKLSDTLDSVRGRIFKLLDTIESEFELLSEYSRSSDRIADQTNLIAVNASIESANTSSGESNFSTVAEGIQRLSSRARDNSDKLHKSILTTKRNFTRNIKLLTRELEEISDTVNILSNISSRSSNFVNQQTQHVQELGFLHTEGKELSVKIEQLVKEYTF